MSKTKKFTFQILMPCRSITAMELISSPLPWNEDENLFISTDDPEYLGSTFQHIGGLYGMGPDPTDDSAYPIIFESKEPIPAVEPLVLGPGTIRFKQKETGK